MVNLLESINVLKKFWFLMVLCVCSVSLGQSLPPDPFLNPMPVPDPISSPDAEELESCADLETKIVVFSMIHGIYANKISTLQAEIAALNLQIGQNSMDIFAAISANASSATLINLRAQGTALIAARNDKQAELDAAMDFIFQIDCELMMAQALLMMGMCQ